VTTTARNGAGLRDFGTAERQYVLEDDRGALCCREQLQSGDERQRDTFAVLDCVITGVGMVGDRL